MEAEREYPKRASGNVIVKPDFMTSRTIAVKSADSLKEQKANGFTPQDWFCDYED